MDISDLTLKQYLFDNLDVAIELDAADHASLSALDTPDGKTLAESVNPEDFEHIRFKLKQKTSPEVIRELVKKYFEENGYTASVFLPEEDSGCAIIVENESHKMTVSIIDTEMEGNGENEINITVA